MAVDNNLVVREGSIISIATFTILCVMCCSTLRKLFAVAKIFHFGISSFDKNNFAFGWSLNF